MDNMLDQLKHRMEKALEVFRHELAKLRTGRASLAMLDDIRVEYYGTQSSLHQLATLSVPDARTLAIQPWDGSSIGAIEKAIQTSGLGLTPMNDGKIVRITIPSLNEERRRELVRMVKKDAEDCKVTMRNIRRDANEQLKKARKESALTEDDERRGHDRIQKMTDEYIKKIDESVEHKEKDIMEV